MVLREEGPRKTAVHVNSAERCLTARFWHQGHGGAARVYDALMRSPRSLSFDPVAAARDVWRSKGWEDAAAGMATVTSIMRAHQLFLARANEVLRPFDLTFARYEVLAWLAWNADCGSLSLSQIGERLQVTPATVTNAIDKLEADDLVRRVPHPSDARTTLAEITPVGRRTVAAATAELNTKVFETVQLSRAEMDSLVRLLVKIRVEAGDFASEPDATPAPGSNGASARRSASSPRPSGRLAAAGAGTPRSGRGRTAR